MDRSTSTTARKRSVSGHGRSSVLLRLAGLVALTVLVTAAVFLGLTVGVQRLTGADGAEVDASEGFLPSFVHDPPSTVKKTDEYGPPGPVSLVFADDQVDTGLTGRLPRAWIAVSAATGDYRALVAPHLPEPSADAIAVSEDGRDLAWAFPEGLVVYDTDTGTARELPVAGDASSTVGGFSPDGQLLTAYGGGVLRVVDVGTGDVVAELAGVDDRSARQATWTPDGTGLTYVARGRLVTRPWRDGPATHAPTSIAERATLDWHPSGNRIAATDTTSTGTRVELFDVGRDGALQPARTLSRPSYSLQRMLGFSGETTVSGIGLGLETGPLPQLYRMSTESPIATDVTQLPADERVVDTLEVAADPLSRGSAPFEEPDWPISERAKLVISVLTGVFVAGLVFTRRSTSRRRRLVN